VLSGARSDRLRGLRRQARDLHGGFRHCRHARGGDHLDQQDSFKDGRRRRSGQVSSLLFLDFTELLRLGEQTGLGDSRAYQSVRDDLQSAERWGMVVFFRVPATNRTRRSTSRSHEPVRDNEYLFTSESVTEGHPDKVADQISTASSMPSCGERPLRSRRLRDAREHRPRGRLG